MPGSARSSPPKTDRLEGRRILKLKQLSWRQLVNKKVRVMNRMQGNLQEVCPELLSTTNDAPNLWFLRLIDRSEAAHQACVEVLEGWRGRILTTEAVLTETLCLLGPSWEAQRACLEFVLRGAVLLIPSSRESLKRVAALICRLSGDLRSTLLASGQIQVC